MVQAEDRTREREQTHTHHETRENTQHSCAQTACATHARMHVTPACVHAAASSHFMADIIFCYSKVPILSLNCNLFNDRICTYMHIEFHELDEYIRAAAHGAPCRCHEAAEADKCPLQHAFVQTLLQAHVHQRRTLAPLPLAQCTLWNTILMR